MATAEKTIRCGELRSPLAAPVYGGATYRRQWEAALGTGIEPQTVTITSFNDWPEGTQIEPAAAGAMRKPGEPYDDYGDLGPNGYPGLTAAFVADFLGIDREERAPSPLRIRIESTSDWTTLTVESGALLVQPVRLSVDETASFYSTAPTPEGEWIFCSRSKMRRPAGR